jgi:hypothetical protein
LHNVKPLHMSDIRNITLSFTCQEKLVRNAAGEFYCDKCAHAITDFRCQSAEALQAAMRSAGTKPVCGIFSRSQLNEKFVRYAAAATIAVMAASATMCTTGEEKAVTPVNNTLPEKSAPLASSAPLTSEEVTFASDFSSIELTSDDIPAFYGFTLMPPTDGLFDHPGFVNGVRDHLNQLDVERQDQNRGL